MTLREVEPDPVAADGVVDSTARFGRRRWRRRLRSLAPWLIGGLLAAILVFALWVALFSSWLGMRQIEVTGLHRVTNEDVVSAADIAPGTPLARVDLDAVEARVEALPEVASATVHRGWPQTLAITVTERRPVAAVHVGDTWWLMDESGTRFDPTPRPQPGRAVVEVGPGVDGETLRQVADVLGQLPPSLRERTSSVTAATPDSIVLHLSGGAIVKWGGSSASALKAVVLGTLLHHKASVYDVSVPSRPATRG